MAKRSGVGPGTYVHEQLGEMVTGETDWAENSESIARFGFIKESIETQEIEATPELAEAKRDLLLAERGRAVPISGPGGQAETSVLLKCIGDFSTLTWRYYDQPVGLATHEADEGTEQALGVGFTSSRVGHFTPDKISDLDGKFRKFPTGRVTISGTSFGNNRSTTITAVDSREVVDFPTTKMAFEANDDWIDSDDELDVFAVGDWTEVTGTTKNNGFWRVRRSGADHVIVRGPGPVLGEISHVGNIRRGTFISVSDTVATEEPGANITITLHGQRIAQAFSITGTTGWAVAKIELRLGRMGMPSDELQLDLCADSSGNPGSVLESVTISPAMLAEERLENEIFAFSNTITLNPATTYHLRLSRTGSNNHENFYLVELDQASSGVQLWDGTAWQVRDPVASLAYRIEGAAETTEQIRGIVAACGQNVISKSSIEASSGIETNQYRDGSMFAYDEIVALMDAGTVSGGGLIAEVTIENILRIRAEPPITAITVQQTDGEQWLDLHGRPLPEGYLPVGQWIGCDDIPSAVAELYRMSPKFLMEAEYDCQAMRIRSYSFRGEPEVDDILGLD